MVGRSTCPQGLRCLNPLSQSGNGGYTAEQSSERPGGCAAHHVALLVVVSCAWAPGLIRGVPAQPASDPTFRPVADERDGQGYAVSSFELRYHEAIPGLPRIAQVGTAFGDLGISLARVRDGFVADRPGAWAQELTINELTADGPTVVYATALDAIERTLRLWFSDQDPTPFGVFISPDPADIDPATGQDLRGPEREGKLRFTIVYDGPYFPVSGFEISYEPPDDAAQPRLPAPQEVLQQVEVAIVRTDLGYVSWRPELEPVSLRLSDLQQAEQFSAGAIQAVLQAIFAYFHDLDFLAIRVKLADNEVDIAGRADRRDGRTVLKVQIIIGRVTELRSLARGNRIDPQKRVDNPKHKRILDHSPFKPASAGDPDASDILKKQELDEYLFLVGRHPGRRLDASISPSADPYGLALDFHVTENKPWTVYGNVANTGTKQTNRWRYRLGAFINQLTNMDDVLSVEWITAGTGNNTVIASYDARVADLDVLRWRVFGNWAEFSASEVGRANEQFSGESGNVGVQLEWNIHQDGPLFIDLFGGLQWSQNEVINHIILTSGRQDFWIPYVGVEIERFTEEAAIYGFAQLEWNMGPVDVLELNQLGRIFAAEHWAIFRCDLSQSLYLEPIFNRKAWLDVDSPESSTLAHELYARFRAQYSFNNRLIPQQEQTVGGLYTVRGYPESIAVGDTAVIVNVEYRWHIPRGFAYDPEPGTLFNRSFRWKPQYPYGRADWDLMFRAFLDVGATYIADGLSFESNQTLLGTGVGIEFLYKTNVAIRVDYGIALYGLPGLVDQGSSRVHFAASILY